MQMRWAQKMLARLYYLTNDEYFKNLAKKNIKFTLDYQRKDGSWPFRIYDDGKFKEQIDFHQGFILYSLYKYLELTGDMDNSFHNALKKGINFYLTQFNECGKSFYRFPRSSPADIHYQGTGIFVLSELSEYIPDLLSVSEKIAQWTIQNMFDKKGYFYYRKYRFFMDKTSYIRWGQAWMLLGLSNLIVKQTKKC